MRHILVLLAMMSLLAVAGGCASKNGEDTAGDPTPETTDNAQAFPFGDPSDPASGQADDEFTEFVLEDEPTPTISDPIEGFNRAMFKFNDFIYFNAFKPIAVTWKAVVPEPARVGLKNAFYNIRFPIRFLNCLFQGKVTRAGQEMGQFLLNSTFGLGGLVNVAQGVNLNPPEEDSDQTLGVWGVGQGPYIVWPLFGPSSARGTVGMVADRFMDPLLWIFWEFDDEALIDFPDDSNKDIWVPIVVTAGERINDLSFRIGDYEALKEASLDPYVALRDAYTQSRRAAVEE